MCSKNFLRRVVPFFATFLMGVFIASFFVSISPRPFGGHRFRHMEEDRQMRLQLERVTEENFRLREQIGERPSAVQRDLIEPGVRGLVPPPPPALPARPTAPREIR